MDEMNNLKYYNEYGGFSLDGKEYVIKVKKENPLPTVWAHVIANKNFGTVVTDSLGGYTWSGNSRLNRLTAWSNNPVLDPSSERIYIKDMDENKFLEFQEQVVRYGFGYAKYSGETDGIFQELDIFVAKEDKAKINIYTLKNQEGEKRNLKIIYYIKPVLEEDEAKSNGYITIEKEDSLIYAKNLYRDIFKDSMLYIGTSEKIISYTGDKKAFIGKGNIESPEANFNNKDALGKDTCVAMELNIILAPFETKEISIILGEENNLIDIKDKVYKYSKIQNCKEELKIVKEFWRDTLGKTRVVTPVESTNLILNGWSTYQTIACRLWSRTGFYQSGGAIGFRDQLQDTLSLKILDSNFTKEQIIKHAAHQFIEGDVEHWWHEETKRGIRTKFSDDLLWLAYTVLEYIDWTNDYSILDKQVHYIKGELLGEEDEKYDIHLPSEISEDIYDHCIRAIDRSLGFGKNGLPKIGSGDWNDGMNTVGNKGIGESVWLGFFLYDILNRMSEICKYRKDDCRAKTYLETASKLKNSLNTNGWDGRWFKRAFTDNGEVLGTMQNDECKIDSIAQSFAVISNAGDNDKKFIAMESLENHLVDRENGIIKLLDPPFKDTKIEPGYIKSYLPGVRENGGQYTHASCWVVIAMCMLGFGDKAHEYFKMINPIEHARTKESAKKYKVEPYVIAADIYGSNNLAGRGGWTWYTGSSSWMYKTGIEYVLGLKIKNNRLSISPCIPKDWQVYTIEHKHKSSKYNIVVKNFNGKNTGVEKFWLNSELVEEKEIELKDDGKTYNIEILM